MRKKLLILLFISFVASCGNPELENHKSNLNLAIADKDHYSIIKHANRVLLIDGEDVEAIAAFRDSARVYSHIKDAAENLKLLNETGIDDVDLLWTMETPNEDPKFLEMLKAFYLTKIDSEATEISMKKLNQYVGGFSEDSAPSDLADSTKGAFVLLGIARAYEKILNNYKEQVDYLVDAKKSLSKAEKLDPRFRGVMDLEEIIDERAEIFTLVLHFYVTSNFMDIVTEAAGYFDDVYAATNSTYDKFSIIPSFTIASAYNFAVLEVNSKDYTKPIKFKQYSDNAQILLTIYKDIEDEFDDIDSLEPAIELVENMIEVIRLTEAEGNLGDWNKAMSLATKSYVKTSKELVSEIEPIDKLDEDRAELVTAIDLILDEEIISAIENSDFI